MCFGLGKGLGGIWGGCRWRGPHGELPLWFTKWLRCFGKMFQKATNTALRSFKEASTGATGTMLCPQARMSRLSPFSVDAAADQVAMLLPTSPIACRQSKNRRTGQDGVRVRIGNPIICKARTEARNATKLKKCAKMRSWLVDCGNPPISNSKPNSISDHSTSSVTVSGHPARPYHLHESLIYHSIDPAIVILVASSRKSLVEKLGAV